MWLFVVLLVAGTMQVSDRYPTWEACDAARSEVEQSRLFKARVVSTTFECKSLVERD